MQIEDIVKLNELSESRMDEARGMVEKLGDIDPLKLMMSPGKLKDLGGVVSIALEGIELKNRVVNALLAREVSRGV